MFAWYEDYSYLDLTAYIGRSGVTCMVPSPTRLTSWNLPLKPFNYDLWLYIIGYIVVETTILLLANQLQLWVSNDSQFCNEKSWRNSFKFAYITMLKLFVSQSSRTDMTSTTIRALLFSIYMVDIIITSIYGGGLASILTLPM